MKVKTSELNGTALDWAVAKCEGDFVENPNHTQEESVSRFFEHYSGLRYSTDWEQAGPIIEREKIATRYWDCAWEASMIYENDDTDEVFSAEGLGPTPLVAAMRCFVESKIGIEVEVPCLDRRNP